MDSQTPGLSGMQWYINDTALEVASPRGSYFKYRCPFKASSSAHFQRAGSTVLRFLRRDRILQPFMHCFWSPVNATGTRT